MKKIEEMYYTITIFGNYINIQTDWQRQTDTLRVRFRQTDIDTDKLRDRQTDLDRQTYICIYIQIGLETDRLRQTDLDRQT